MINLRGKLLGFIVLSFLIASSLVGFEKALSAGVPIKLKVQFIGNPESTFSLGQNWVLKEIEVRSKGRVIFERYWTQSLAKAKDIPDALAGGIIDVGIIIPSYFPGKLPLADVGSLPCMGIHLWPTMMAYYEAWRNVQELRDESTKRGVTMLSPVAAGPYNLLMNKKIQSLDDIKRLKIRSVGYQAHLMEALGANAINITAPEIYDALQKGTVDGVALDSDLAVTYGLQRAAKYFNRVPLGVAVFYLGISTQKFNSLPADVQKIIEDIVPEAIKAYAQIYEVDGDLRKTKIMVDQGVQVIAFPPDQTARIMEISKNNIWEKWVADMASKGHPGRKVFDVYKKAADKFMRVDPMRYE